MNLKVFLLFALSVLTPLHTVGDQKFDKTREALLDAFLDDSRVVDCMMERLLTDKMVSEVHKAVTSVKKSKKMKIEDYLHDVEYRCLHPPALLTPLGIAALLSVVFIVSAFVASMLKLISR